MGRDRWVGNDLRPEAGGGRVNAVVTGEVESGRRHQRREPRHEIEGLESDVDVGGPISPSIS